MGMDFSFEFTTASIHLNRIALNQPVLINNVNKLQMCNIATTPAALVVAVSKTLCGNRLQQVGTIH